MASAPHPSLEAGIYALGRLEFADDFASEEDPATRSALIEAKIYLTYGRQLNNLGIQERRLRNQLAEDLDQLKQMQKERRQRANAALTHAVQLYEEAKKEGEEFDPAEFGFEFSMEEIEQRLAHLELVRAGRSHSIPEILTRKSSKAA